MKDNQRCSLALLLTGLLLTTAAAKADLWSFRLVGPPVAININSPGHESICMTGGGTFDPKNGGSVEAHGTYVLFNSGDHPKGPVVPGTWRATGFVSWTPDSNSGKDSPGGTLVIEIDEQDSTGGTNHGTLVVMEDSISGLIYEGETYLPAFNDQTSFYKYPELNGGAVFQKGDDHAEHGD
jgi:hypothetical protein